MASCRICFMADPAVAEALAREVGVDPDRVLAWTAIWTVHQAAQAWIAGQLLKACFSSSVADRITMRVQPPR